LAAPKAGGPAVLSSSPPVGPPGRSSPAAGGSHLAVPGVAAQTAGRQLSARPIRGAPLGRLVTPAPADQGPPPPRRVGTAEEMVGGSASQGAPARALPPLPPPPDHAATSLELQKARDQLIVMESRASSLRATIETLKRSQAAMGVGLR